MIEDVSILIVGDEGNSLYPGIKEVVEQYKPYKLISAMSVEQQLEKGEPIDIAIVLYHPEASVLEIIQTIKKQSPATAILFLHHKQEFQLMREVLRQGAMDYLVIPDEVNLLPERLQAMRGIAKANAHQSGTSSMFSRGRGEVIAFYSGKGGSGTTLISSSFAQTVKLDSTAQVILIDLNHQYGGAETYLGIESNRSLVDLKPVIHELNESHIHNVTEKEKHSNLEVLISPRDTEAAESIDEDFIRRLIRICKRSFDFVILDLPGHIDVTSYAAAAEADKIFYCITPDTPSIRVFKGVEELFKRLGIKLEGSLELVVNQIGKENELNAKDLTRFIHYPIAVQIKRDAKGVLQAINKGEPIRKETKEKKLSQVAKDLQKWVATMLK